MDLIKNLEIPVCLKLAKCYMLIEKPQAKKALEYCSRVIDKNLGVVPSSDEPDDLIQMSYRSKAFFRRAQALKALGKHKQAKEDLLQASKISTLLQHKPMSTTEKETNQKLLALIKKEVKEVSSHLQREAPAPGPSQVIEINVREPRKATSGSERVREKVYLNDDQYQFIMAFMYFFQLVQVYLWQAAQFGAYCFAAAKKLAEPSALTRSLRKIDGIEKGSFQDHAFGCILGAFVGDACGATTSPTAQVLTKAEAEKALKMNGGGAHGVGPGQVTGDSELALCLMAGIADANKGREAE